MTKEILRMTPELEERLEFFSNGPIEYEDEKKSATAIYGALYGIRIKSMSDYPILVNITGNTIFENEYKKSDINPEFIAELFPVGIDPVGIMYLTSDENDDNASEIIPTLIDNLPENDSYMHDPIIITKKGKEPIIVSVYTEGEYRTLNHTTISMEELSDNVTTMRVKGTLELLSQANEKDIISWIKHAIEKVSCPYGSFKLENSNTYFLHSFAPAPKKATGWIATEMFKEEYQEECKVSNLQSINPEMTSKEISEKYTINDLWSVIQAEEEEDDGFGVTDKKKQKKKAITKSETMNFKLMMKMSGDACTTKTRNCAPVIHYEKVETKIVKMPLNFDGLAMVPNETKIVDVMEFLKGCIQRQVHILGGSVLSEFKKLESFSKPQVFHFKPKPFGHMMSIVYTETGTCSFFAPFRMKLHRKFLLKPEKPYFRRANRYTFESDKPKGGVLTNVHEGLAPSGVNGEVAIVDGIYSYHHYMQDNFDDNGWGCAYRSLQTLISWFRHQGYAETTIPSHEQIQKCLVDMGDKERKFIGSKQWIGSTEVGYVLEKSCNVQCKFLSVSSGEDLENKGRELAHHFKTNGTPIMIGGGVLAHTILGVDWDEAGNIAWLILDPHYTGSDWTNDKKPNLSQIQSKGWVGWKKPGFWDKTAFYNLCMPQRPVNF